MQWFSIEIVFGSVVTEQVFPGIEAPRASSSETYICMSVDSEVATEMCVSVEVDK